MLVFPEILKDKHHMKYFEIIIRRTPHDFSHNNNTYINRPIMKNSHIQNNLQIISVNVYEIDLLRIFIDFVPYVLIYMESLGETNM
jgi:hypothetical protein